MKVLVTSANYALTDNKFSVYFVRGRNIYYKQNGIDVSVLNFAAKQNYVIDDIPVYSLKSFKEKLLHEKFDILICHAPNIRNHYIFLNKYHQYFPKIVFFFHGHEVLNCSRVYPKPYSYLKQASWHKRFFRELYDIIKLKLWRSYFTKLSSKSHFIFVSNWMYIQFLKWSKVDSVILKNRRSIIYNNANSIFEKNEYQKSDDIYDFITIRGNLDGSKYCIDIVVNLAKQYPQYKFCIVGKGKFFYFNKKPENIVWIDKHLNHQEIIELLNQSRCALMPTRADAQGVMACEMATFGIPLITSDIDVCKEVFEGFKNVAFIDNDNEYIDIEPILKKLESIGEIKKNEKYFAKNTVQKEIELFKTLKG